MAARTDLWIHLKNEPSLPVYTLVSSETVLQQEAVQYLRRALVPQTSDFNQNFWRLGDVSLPTVIQAAQTMPFMSDKRFVLLSDLQKLKATEQDALLTYLKDPNPTTILCLCADKLDLRQKLAKQLQEMQALFILDLPVARALPEWLIKRAQKRSLRITLEAAQLLVEWLGTDIGVLDRAIDAASCYAKDAMIEAEHIAQTVTQTTLPSIFAFTDALGNRDLSKATLLLQQLMTDADSALPTLAMITRQIRLLLNTQALLSQKLSELELAKQLGVRPFVVGTLLQQAQCYQQPELQRALELAMQVDWQCKSSRLSGSLLLQNLVFKMIA
jgi:DNA polymerase III subunit delta